MMILSKLRPTGISLVVLTAYVPGEEPWTALCDFDATDRSLGPAQVRRHGNWARITPLPDADCYWLMTKTHVKPTKTQPQGTEFSVLSC
jgi:hypothetical protein